MKIVVRLIGICAILAALSASQAGHAEEPGWPQFRGPGGAGVADQAALPERWSATENVAWVAELPGRGWSSPIVAGERPVHRPLLDGAEGGLALVDEDVGDAAALLGHDVLVGVPESAAQPFGQQRAHGRLADAHRADQDDPRTATAHRTTRFSR